MHVTAGSLQINACMHDDIYVVFHIQVFLGPVTPQMVLRHNWSPGPSAANYVAVDGPPGPSIAAMDGPLCRKYSPCSKPEKQWLQLKIDLYMLTGEFGD